jgi:hypothetical protein
MVAPFQGIDDGLGGKNWPTLPRKDHDAAAQANGWLIPKNKTILASSTEDPGTKVVGLNPAFLDVDITHLQQRHIHS